MDFMWSRQLYNKRGDVEDYILALEYRDSKLAAIKRAYHTLQINVTTLEVITANELMDMEFEPRYMLIDRLIGCDVTARPRQAKVGQFMSGRRQELCANSFAGSG